MNSNATESENDIKRVPGRTVSLSTPSSIHFQQSFIGSHANNTGHADKHDSKSQTTQINGLTGDEGLRERAISSVSFYRFESLE